MNRKLDEFKKYIADKKVAVLGIGISNTPLIKYLAGLGVDVTAFDKADRERLEPTLEGLKGLDLKFSLGEGYLQNLHDFDVIFKTPIVRFDLPELIDARQKGAVITSEMEVFVELCPAQIFAVTGSDGKTTTTTLIYNMLKQEGYNCWLGGNIGIPLLERIDEIDENDKVVLELSSFQLHTMRSSAHIAVITNLSPNHLDVHKSMDEYIDAKKNIFKYQLHITSHLDMAKPKVILNYDNEITKALADEAPCDVIFFSRLHELQNGAMLKDGKLVYIWGGRETSIIEENEVILPGMHNLENYLAAIAAVAGYVSPEAIKKVATTFRGVEHRMEPVRVLHGIRFYNDSIGSSPTRTIAGLKAFKQKVILIAGGYDKKIPYDCMGEVLAEKVKRLVLTGPTAPKIEKALRDEADKTGKGADVPVDNCKTLEEAVKCAYKGASEGDIIILSPASASFDMFRNFEERGNRFKELVNALK